MLLCRGPASRVTRPRECPGGYNPSSARTEGGHVGAADIVRRQAEAQNEGDLDAVIDLFAEDVVWNDPQGRVDGRDGARSRYNDLYAAFPDGKVELGRVVEQ